MVIVPPATPAVAHDSWANGWRWVHLPGPGLNQLCVGGSGWQNHAEHWIGTHSFFGDCATLWDRKINALWNRGEWYWNGRFCFQVGWRSNQVAASTFWTTRFQDLWWEGCNSGWMVHGSLTMDTWHVAATDNWVWRPNADGLPGVRPITSHCHCP